MQSIASLNNNDQRAGKNVHIMSYTVGRVFHVDFSLHLPKDCEILTANKTEDGTIELHVYGEHHGDVAPRTFHLVSQYELFLNAKTISLSQCWKVDI